MRIRTFEISRVTLFIVFAVTILVKCILFQSFCFGSLTENGLLKTFQDYISFSLAKLLPAISIASFVFLFKRKWWIVIASIIIDLWLISNLIYYRANDLFLDVETIMIADNLSGFGRSISTYVNWKAPTFLILTILFSCFLACATVKNNRQWKGFVVASVVSVALFLGDHFAGYSTYKTTPGAEPWMYSSFKTVYEMSSGRFYYSNWVRKQWVEGQTPLHFVPALLYKSCCDAYYKKTDLKLTDEDKAKINTFIDYSAKDSDTVHQNLIIILGESFESWALEMNEDGFEVTPTMNELRKKEHVLYADKIRSQVLRGTSGDGQMIINTGLLPIRAGAACMLFGDNVYPNYAHNFDSAVIVNPIPTIWNQPVVTFSYGYNKLNNYQFHDTKRACDADLMEMAIQQCATLQKPFGLMIITLSTHSPFWDYPSVKEKTHFKDFPKLFRDYLYSMHYADSCLGVFIDYLKERSLLDNTTLVVTGDHTIFRSSILAEMKPVAQKYNLSIPQEESFCPLIICSPTIEKHTEIDTICYQMDIYPTILHCLGINDYYWKGFGANLLDSTAMQHRKISVDEAFRLSNLIIRSNYFKDMK